MADSIEIVEASLLPPDDGSEDVPARRWRRRPSLVVLLAAALVLTLAAGVVGWALWRDRGLTDGQADAVSVVEQYTAALDTHDLTALRATLADQASFSGGERPSLISVGPFSGKELDGFYGSMFRAGVHLTTDGPVQVAGRGPYQVVAVQTVQYTVAGVAVTQQGLSLFTLVQHADRPVIVEHVWWRPPPAQAQAQPPGSGGVGGP